MLHLLVFVVFIWPILFLPLIFICGKASKTKTVKKEQKSDGAMKSQEDGKIAMEELRKKLEKDEEEERKRWEKEQEEENKQFEENERARREKMNAGPQETFAEKIFREEQELLKERDDPEESKEIYELLNDKKRMEELGKKIMNYCYSSRENSIDSCAYWKYFKKCDFEWIMTSRYHDMRNAAKETASTAVVVEVGRWMYADIKLGEAMHPLFEKFTNEYYEAHHKEHTQPDTLEKLKEIYQQILDQHKVILTAYDEFKKKGKEVYERCDDYFCYKAEKEKWARRPFTLFLFEKENRNENKLIKEVLDLCKKKYGCGDCDFLERINYYIYEERKRAMKRAFESKDKSFYGRFIGPVPVSDVREWLRLDAKELKESLVFIKERLGKHKEHAKDPKKLDEMVEKHEKMLAKIKECSKQLDGKKDDETVDAALIKKEIPVLGGRWDYKHGYHYEDLSLRTYK